MRAWKNDRMFETRDIHRLAETPVTHCSADGLMNDSFEMICCRDESSK